MRSDIQDTLLSVQEVAVFTWSLLELLLTRILPLATFLAGHLLLESGKLLASVVIPASGRRVLPSRSSWYEQAEEPIKEYKVQVVKKDVYRQDYLESPSQYSCDEQAEELIEEDNVQVGKGDEDHQNELGSITSTDTLEENELGSITSTDKLEESQLIETEESLLSPSVTVDGGPDAQAAPAASIVDAVDHQSARVGKSAPPDGEMSKSGSVARNIESTPTDVKWKVGAANEVADSGNDGGQEAQAKLFKLEQVHRERDVQTRSQEATTSGSSTDMGMRKSRRRMRVLPPSLSQIKRTLMERSRRASPSSWRPLPSRSKAGTALAAVSERRLR